MQLTQKQETQLMRLLLFMLPFGIINAYLLNLALPQIAKTFEITPAVSSLVVTISGIISAVGALIYGKLADSLGIKKIVTFGTILFAIGSIICFLAPTYAILIAGRIVQAIGVSVIPTIGMLTPTRFIAPERRGKALGTLASVMAISGMIGPVLAGILIGFLHWRFLFLFPILLLIALPFVRKWFPDENPQQSIKINTVGASLLVATVICVMQAITFVNWILLVSGLVCLVVFIIQNRRSAQPFLPHHLFTTKSYRHGIYMGIINTAANFTVFLITPLLLTHIYGLTASLIGLVLLPGALLSALLGKYGGMLADRNGTRSVLKLGTLLMGIGFLALSTVVGMPVWMIAICLLFVEVAYIFMQPALANWISQNLPSEHTGIGMGVYNLCNFLAIALCGTLSAKSLEWSSLLVLNPVVSLPAAGVYSNLYIGFFFLAVINLLFVYRLGGNRHSATLKPERVSS